MLEGNYEDHNYDFFVMIQYFILFIFIFVF